MSTTADALSDNAGQDTFSTDPIPLRQRRRDWFFVVMFAIFASTSFLTDTVTLLGRPDPNSQWFMSRFVYHSGTDSLILVDPRFVQVTVGTSAVLFGVFYLVLIYAFVRGREWIRLPAVFYAGMIVMGTGVYLAVGLLGDAPLFHLACGPDSAYDYKFVSAAKSLAYNLPYPLVALLLVARMSRAHPFTRRAHQDGRRLIVRAAGVAACNRPEGFKGRLGAELAKYCLPSNRLATGIRPAHSAPPVVRAPNRPQLNGGCRGRTACAPE